MNYGIRHQDSVYFGGQGAQGLEGIVRRVSRILVMSCLLLRELVLGVCPAVKIHQTACI